MDFIAYTKALPANIRINWKRLLGQALGLRHNTQHNDSRHNDTQHNDIQHNGVICDPLHNSIACHNAQCRYAECLYAECRFAECGFAECRGGTRAISPYIRLGWKCLLGTHQGALTEGEGSVQLTSSLR